MEVPVYLFLGLLGTGLYMKNKQPASERFENDSNGHTLVKQSGGKNIYESTEYNNVTRTEFEAVNNNWQKSYDTINTNIVPFYFNTLKEDDKQKRIVNPNYDPKLATKVPERFKDMLTTDTQQKPKELVNPYNATLETSTWDTMVPDQGKDLRHANMVPFFGSRVTQNVNAADTLRKVETFTGQLGLNKQHKEEIAPHFEPTAGLTNVNGSYVKDRDMSRYIPNNIGKKNNETPFEKIYVGPGLNDGYTAKPSGGFHNSLRVVPKTTEELLVNPKFEKEGRINTGKGETEKRTLEMQVHKNRPELLVENNNGERNFTTTGTMREAIAIPEYIIRDTSNKNNRAAMNTAAPATQKHHLSENMMAKSKKSTRKNYENTPYRNVAANVKKAGDYGKSGWSMKPNERMTTGTKQFSTFVKGNHAKGSVYNSDKARDTKKQQYIKAHRAFGNSASNKHKGKVYNVDETAKGTIRQQTEKNKYKAIASAVDKKPRSYKSAYAMEQNYDKEIITKMPKRSGSGVKVVNGSETITMETKKIDYDRVNSRAFAKDSASGNVFNPENISKDTMTSYKNSLSNDYQQQRYNPDLLNAYRSNPLTQSLLSYY